MSLHQLCKVVAVLVLAGAHVPLPGAAQTNAPLLLLIAKSVGGHDISFAQLKSAYENQPTEYRGQRLIPFNLPVGHVARTRFDRIVLGLAPERVGAFWIDQRIRSGVVAPRTASSPDLLIRVVASMPGVIGYVEASPSSIPASIQILTIDGKGSGDLDYPLAAP